MSVIKCNHYNRNCDVYTECCKSYYSCIHCHNNYDKNLYTHEITSKDITLIKCKKCNIEQNISNKCVNCECIFGEYFCNKCKIWDDTSKQIIHCDKCGLCRVSNGKQIYHCDKCNICAFEIHDKCFEIDLCPICTDELKTSIISATKLRCGHWIHVTCLELLLKKDYKCPMCYKSIYNPLELEKLYDEEIEKNKVPEDLIKQVNILCNDCEKKSETAYHYLAIKCPQCRSYNTKEY